MAQAMKLYYMTYALLRTESMRPVAGVGLSPFPPQPGRDAYGARTGPLRIAP